MNPSAHEFRVARLNVLEFLSDLAAQRAFATKVRYEAYAPEFYSWWFEDYDPGSAQFTSAFSSIELQRLQGFSEAYIAADAEIADRKLTIEELQSLPQWGRIALAAKETLEAINEVAT